MSDVEMVDNDAVPSKGKEQSQETTFILRNPPHVYIYLLVKQLPGSVPIQLDPITARSYLLSALSQFLGLTGAAIQVDLLKVEGKDIWLRVAREDANAVVAAVSQWASAVHGVSLQVKARGTWLGAVLAKGRMDEKLWTLEK